jgi:hypothetical protein
MNVIRYVPIDEIVEGVYINAGYQQVDWNEALAYIGRIIGLLGVPEGFDTVVTSGSDGNPDPLTIVNYTAVLPTELISINQVREFYSKQALVYSTDAFHFNPDDGIATNSQFNPDYPTVDWTAYGNIDQSDLADEDTRRRFFQYHMEYENELERNLEIHSANSRYPAHGMLTYKTQGGIIFTNFKEGVIELSYQAYPVDKNGFPMIPDNEYYKRAVETFLQERIDYKLWRQGKIQDKVYQDTQQKYAWAVRSATGHMAIPSIDQMESIKNMMLRLVADQRAHSSGMKYNANRERIWKV